MTGKLYIDGTDAYTAYGAFPAQGAYKAVVQMPPFKTPDSTEWPEEDGAEYDLEAPVLDARTLSLPIFLSDVSQAADLFAHLSDGAYHTFKFTELGREYKLRLTTNSSFDSIYRLGKIALTFSDDFPAVPSGSPYATAPVPQQGYELDGVDLSRYGAIVLDGTDGNLRKAPAVRENLLVDAASVAGVTYDGEAVTYRPKDADLRLFIGAAGITEFWRRWDALFAALVHPGERLLYFDRTGETMGCFYKKCSVSRFELLPGGRVWCEFSVALTFTSPEPQGGYALLAFEDGNELWTEDGESNIVLRK